MWLKLKLTPVASNWHLHLPQGQASAYKGSSIDHGLSTDAIETSAVLQEGSRPQAILKFHRPSSFDYRAHHGLSISELAYEAFIDEIFGH